MAFKGLSEKELANLLLEKGFVTKDQLEQILQIRKRAREQGEQPLGILPLIRKKEYVNEDELNEITEAVDLRLISQKISGYKLTEKLGEGSMGEVYKAVQMSMDRTVALKTIHTNFVDRENFVERFKREARIVASLNHPNILIGYDFGEGEGLYYFVMEYVDGETLKERLKREGPLDIDEAIDMLLQMARALEHAHKHDLIHRDVKPDNIMITGDGIAKLCDLGLAKGTSAGQSNELTKTGQTLGTPYYMSPEQVEGAKHVDIRTDIYGLGTTFYHALTGEVPYDGESMGEIMKQHMKGTYKPPSEIREDIPGDLEKVIGTMMARDLEDRYESPEELTADLEQVQQGRSPVSARQLPAYRKRMKNWITWGGIAAAVVLLGAGIFFAWQHLPSGSGNKQRTSGSTEQPETASTEELVKLQTDLQDKSEFLNSLEPVTPSLSNNDSLAKLLTTFDEFSHKLHSRQSRLYKYTREMEETLRQTPVSSGETRQSYRSSLEKLRKVTHYSHFLGIISQKLIRRPFGKETVKITGSSEKPDLTAGQHSWRWLVNGQSPHRILNVQRRKNPYYFLRKARELRKRLRRRFLPVMMKFRKIENLVGYDEEEKFSHFTRDDFLEATRIAQQAKKRSKQNDHQRAYVLGKDYGKQWEEVEKKLEDYHEKTDEYKKKQFKNGRQQIDKHFLEKPISRISKSDYEQALQIHKKTRNQIAGLIELRDKWETIGSHIKQKFQETKQHNEQTLIDYREKLRDTLNLTRAKPAGELIQNVPEPPQLGMRYHRRRAQKLYEDLQRIPKMEDQFWTALQTCRKQNIQLTTASGKPAHVSDIQRNAGKFTLKSTRKKGISFPKSLYNMSVENRLHWFREVFEKTNNEPNNQFAFARALYAYYGNNTKKALQLFGQLNKRDDSLSDMYQAILREDDQVYDLFTTIRKHRESLNYRKAKQALKTFNKKFSKSDLPEIKQDLFERLKQDLSNPASFFGGSPVSDDVSKKFDQHIHLAYTNQQQITRDWNVISPSESGIESRPNGFYLKPNTAIQFRRPFNRSSDNPISIEVIFDQRNGENISFYLFGEIHSTSSPVLQSGYQGFLRLSPPSLSLAVLQKFPNRPPPALPLLLKEGVDIKSGIRMNIEYENEEASMLRLFLIDKMQEEKIGTTSIKHTSKTEGEKIGVQSINKPFESGYTGVISLKNGVHIRRVRIQGTLSESDNQ